MTPTIILLATNIEQGKMYRRAMFPDLPFSDRRVQVATVGRHLMGRPEDTVLIKVGQFPHSQADYDMLRRECVPFAPPLRGPFSLMDMGLMR